MPPFGVELKHALGNGPMKIAKLFENTRVVEMSNRVAELGKDSGKLVIELDLRGNMDAATIRESFGSQPSTGHVPSRPRRMKS